ncbi:hypothetical protein C8Q77DRAFT_1210122 [Trametes polyzona]|nr:hypothetical protein C8Q77DRAFT_1210122 [Trametes polyzona]
MSWFYDYRAFAYVVSLGSQIAVFVSCYETRKIGGASALSLSYASLGLVCAVLTSVPLVIALLRDCGKNPVNVKTELICLPLLIILWLVVGGVSTVAKHHNFGYDDCGLFTDPTMYSICSYADPISTFSFVPAGLVISYELVLAFVAAYGVWGKKPVWKSNVRGTMMSDAGF